jgi:hypothetical protein
VHTDVEGLKDRIGAIVAALSLAGAFVFAAQRVAYERFYDHFGLEPEDVGIDFTHVVQQTAGGVGIAGFLAGIFVAVVAAIWQAAQQSRPEAQRHHLTPTIFLWVWLALAGWFVLVVILSNWAAVDGAGRCGTQADGRPVRGFRTHLPFGMLVTRLAIRADRAVVTAANPTGPAAQRWDRRRLVYLGTNAGTVFLYDPASNQTTRVPASNVVVSIDTTTPRYTSQDGCRRPT